MSRAAPTPVRNLVYLLCAASLLTFSNCSTPDKPVVRRPAAPLPMDEPDPAPARTSTAPEIVAANIVDRKARVATQLTPNDVLQLAAACAARHYPDFLDYDVASVSLNLNLGLPMAATGSKLTWVVVYLHKAVPSHVDRDFRIYVDDTTRTARNSSGQ